MANASARVTSRMTNELVLGTTIASAASATTTISIFANELRMGSRYSRPNRPVGLTARISAIGA